MHMELAKVMPSHERLWADMVKKYKLQVRPAAEPISPKEAHVV